MQHTGSYVSAEEVRTYFCRWKRDIRHAHMFVSLKHDFMLLGRLHEGEGFERSSALQKTIENSLYLHMLSPEDPSSSERCLWHQVSIITRVKVVTLSSTV
jgi:hypothetical protein